MLRGADPVDAARPRVSCGAGAAADLEGRTSDREDRARLALATQAPINSSSAPIARASAIAAYWMPASPVGTTPPMTPSPISPIVALTDNPPDGSEAIPMPVGSLRQQHRDFGGLLTGVAPSSVRGVTRQGNFYKVIPAGGRLSR